MASSDNSVLLWLGVFAFILYMLSKMGWVIITNNFPIVGRLMAVLT